MVGGHYIIGRNDDWSGEGGRRVVGWMPIGCGVRWDYGSIGWL